MNIEGFLEFFGRVAFAKEPDDWRLTEDGYLRWRNQCPVSFVANAYRETRTRTDSPEFFAGIAGEAGRYIGLDPLSVLDIMDAADCAESSRPRIRELRRRLLLCVGFEEKP